MFPSSPSHIYDQTPAVTRQIDFAGSTFVRWTEGPVTVSDWEARLL